MGINTNLGSSGYNNRYPYYGPGSGFYVWASPRNFNVGLSVGTQVNGINLASVFKINIARKAVLFVKGGLNMAVLNYQANYSQNPRYPMYRSVSNTFFGYQLGSGIEYYLSKRLGLLIGGSYVWLFNGSDPQISGVKDPYGPKINLGVIYKL